MGQDDVRDLPVSDLVVWLVSVSHIGSDVRIVICMLMHRFVQNRE